MEWENRVGKKVEWKRWEKVNWESRGKIDWESEKEVAEKLSEKSRVGLREDAGQCPSKLELIN